VLVVVLANCVILVQGGPAHVLMPHQENLKTTASNVAEDLRGGIQRAREEIRQPPAPGAYAYPTETRPLSIYESVSTFYL
jgi:hypothetical protein